MLDAVACCGTGIENLNENVNGKWLMPLIDFRQITMSAPENIKMIKVKGDSMEPTLKEGDWVLVDISRISPDSDGLFCSAWPAASPSNEFNAGSATVSTYFRIMRIIPLCRQQV